MVLQSRARGAAVRRQLDLSRHAAVTIQSAWRMQSARASLRRAVAAVTTLQVRIAQPFPTEAYKIMMQLCHVGNFW